MIQIDKKLSIYHIVTMGVMLVTLVIFFIKSDAKADKGIEAAASNRKDIESLKDQRSRDRDRIVGLESIDSKHDLLITIVTEDLKELEEEFNASE